MQTITPETISADARYNLTRHTPAEADTIRAIANELDLLAAVYDELKFAVQVWLAVYAPDAMSLYAKYEVASAVELACVMMDTCANSTDTKTGGNEKYPISTWKTWIGKNKAAIAKLQAAFDYAREDMISQADSVNWWAS